MFRGPVELVCPIAARLDAHRPLQPHESVPSGMAPASALMPVITLIDAGTV